MAMSWEKIVNRAAVSQIDSVSDLIGLIDVIEVYLGIGTGERSARERLAAAITEIQRAGGAADEGSIEILLDVAERLRKVEALLAASGFETRKA
jgi:hypothetical protein